MGETVKSKIDATARRVPASHRPAKRPANYRRLKRLTTCEQTTGQPDRNSPNNELLERVRFYEKFKKVGKKIMM